MGESPEKGREVNIGAQVREIIAESPVSKQLEPVPDVVPVGGPEAVPGMASEPVAADIPVVNAGV